MMLTTNEFPKYCVAENGASIVLIHYRGSTIIETMIHMLYGCMGLFCYQNQVEFSVIIFSLFLSVVRKGSQSAVGLWS